MKKTTVLDWMIVGLMVLLFPAMVETHTLFSPDVLNSVLGYDVSLLYGIAVAVVIAGLVISFQLNHRASSYLPARIAKWVFVAIACLSFMVYGVFNVGAPDAIKAVFVIMMPLVPVFVLIVLFVIGRIPNDVANTQS